MELLAKFVMLILKKFTGKLEKALFMFIISSKSPKLAKPIKLTQFKIYSQFVRIVMR